MRRKIFLQKWRDAPTLPPTELLPHVRVAPRTMISNRYAIRVMIVAASIPAADLGAPLGPLSPDRSAMLRTWSKFALKRHSTAAIYS